MNHCAMQQKHSFASSCNEMICPKPRRRLSLVTAVINDQIRPLRRQMCYQSEPYESTPVSPSSSSSPPFFNGSPPSRVSNPLTQDNRFKDSKVPIPASGMSLPSSSSSSSETKVVPVDGSYGDKPAVRIVGFDCIATLG